MQRGDPGERGIDSPLGLERVNAEDLTRDALGHDARGGEVDAKRESEHQD